jgi:hypothetical protein
MMDRALIERLKREAGWTGIYTQWVSATERASMTVPVTEEQLERFVALVVEECAKEAERVPLERYATPSAEIQVREWRRAAAAAIRAMFTP